MSVVNELVEEIVTRSVKLEQCDSKSSLAEQLQLKRTRSSELVSEFLRIFIDVLGILPACEISVENSKVAKMN